MSLPLSRAAGNLAKANPRHYSTGSENAFLHRNAPPMYVSPAEVLANEKLEFLCDVRLLRAPLRLPNPKLWPSAFKFVYYREVRVGKASKERSFRDLSLSNCRLRPDPASTSFLKCTLQKQSP